MGNLKTGYEDFNDKSAILGIDEVGYGAGAGPLVMAGVLLGNISSNLFRDSKKLSEKKRVEAKDFIEQSSVEFFVAHASVKYINKYGIVKAIEHCVNQILDHFNDKIDLILMDGINWYNNTTLPVKCVPKGDDTYQPIAAASIMAKVYRDNYMVKLNKEIPGYAFDENKGYLTEKHRNGILEFGITPYHRNQYVESWLSKRI